MGKQGKKGARRPRERGSIVARGERRWLVRVFVGRELRDGRSKRKYVSTTVSGTWAQACQERTRLLREIDTKTHIAPTKQTLREYITGYKTPEEETARRSLDTAGGHVRGWLHQVVAHRVSARTLQSYADALRLHVMPALGERRLEALSPQDVQGVYTGMILKGLSPRTVRLAHTVLSNALSEAVRWRLLPHNPAEFATLPRKARRTMTALTGRDVANLLDKAKARSDELYPLWHVLLLTGLRPGEARALRWEDYDGTHLSVQRAIARSGTGRVTYAEPKTSKSRRRVALLPETAAALDEHRRAQLHRIIGRGAAYQRNDLIFATSNGTPLDEGLLRRRWKAALRASGLPSVRLYDARHTHATMMLTAGLSPKVAAERLGHSSVTMTLDTYSHVLPEIEARTTQVLQDVLARKVG